MATVETPESARISRYLQRCSSHPRDRFHMDGERKRLAVCQDAIDREEASTGTFRLLLLFHFVLRLSMPAKSGREGACVSA